MDLNPGQRQKAPEPPRRSFGADLFVLAAIIAGLFSLIAMGKEWHQPFKSTVDIDLSPWMLPYYTMLSFLRGAVAYGLSLAFTLFYARWAGLRSMSENFSVGK